MEISAKEIASILDLIHMKWTVGPKGVAKGIGYSRQSIHNWKQKGASQKQYAKLKQFLQNGPEPQVAHSPNSELFINLSLRIDIITPSEEVKAKVERMISLLESIRKSWV